MGLSSTCKPGFGLAPSGAPTPSLAVSYSFSGSGCIQVAAEGTKSVGALLELPLSASRGVTLQAGCRVGTNERLSYGAGVTAEM